MLAEWFCHYWVAGGFKSNIYYNPNQQGRIVVKRIDKVQMITQMRKSSLKMLRKLLSRTVQLQSF